MSTLLPQVAMFAAILGAGFVFGCVATSTHDKGTLWRVLCITAATILIYPFTFSITLVVRNVGWFVFGMVSFVLMVCIGIMGNLDHRPSQFSKVVVETKAARSIFVRRDSPTNSTTTGRQLARRDMLARQDLSDTPNVIAAQESTYLHVETHEFSFTNGTGAMVRVMLYGVTVSMVPYVTLRAPGIAAKILIPIIGIVVSWLLLGNLRYKQDPVEKLFT